MNTLQLSVVHRLPQSYRWSAGLSGGTIEPLEISGLTNDNDLIGLKLLSHNGESAWDIMQILKTALNEIQVECAVVEWQGEPCLFVHRNDESATNCRLKNQGVAIAEAFSASNPF
ncbi:hypothetical protein J2125_000759 [Erwinia toletana]|uniref:YejG-like protein n=1 Tax=Winslowiella toletana TaxID=92490 RepID=A0ABS4P4J9_9GAMM|nr:YejG family protein [Winslowiella toletana]MBP2167567.1 hypothetical protein [Winslowiella toletana]